jgi:hypothetical protein
MPDLNHHISAISQAIDEWLHPGNRVLKHAIDQTADEGFFSFEDIKHRILVLKNTLQTRHLKTWAQRSQLRLNSLTGKNVVCLHAGNIPVVGIHDLLAVVMTGGRYTGKISRKDPYLLPSFLDSLQSHGLADDAFWSTQISDLYGQSGDALLFAGSEQSVESVYQTLNRLKLITPETPSLIRTAHFSAAFLTDHHSQTMEDLTEAVFRYGGAGCRSAAIVVAPFHLDSQKCSFTDYVESFWLKNPQHEKPAESLFYRYAYNKAIEIPQAWLNDFLIEETISKPKEKFILHWVKGDFETLKTVVEHVKPGLQSVYSTSELIGKSVGNFRIEPLSESQSPPVWWKPDQVDTIEWLQNHSGKSGN